MLASVADWLVVRLQLLFQGGLVGLLTGSIGIVGFTLLTDLLRAAELTFALAVALLGFAVLGWAGSIMAGRGIENLQYYLNTGTEWSEADSRQAMTLLSGVGLGGMLVATVVTWLVW